jgi:hypothetical protein
VTLPDAFILLAETLPEVGMALPVLLYRLVLLFAGMVLLIVGPCYLTAYWRSRRGWKILVKRVWPPDHLPRLF